MDWSDLHLLLRLSRQTLRQAAHAAGVDETTMSRRLKAVERAVGATLFRREGRRLVPTEAAYPLIARAERMEQALLSTEAPAGQRPLVRISSVAPLIDHVLAPHLPDLLDGGPDMLVQLEGRDSMASLAQREADISLRMARPREGRLIVRKLGELVFRLVSMSARPGQRLIAYTEDLDSLPEIQAGYAATSPVPAVRLSGSLATIAAVRQGLGAAMLPEPLIRSDMTILDPDVTAIREVWLVWHEDLHDRPEIRRTTDWIARIVPPALNRKWKQAA